MSAIGETASITLITAVPGSGKTLRAVWHMAQAVKDGDLVFASNVNGLTLEGVTDFPDPTQWETLPPGSVLVVDEAQKFFRAGISEVLPDPVTGKPVKQVPSFITAMEEIRHGGVRLILLTQHPALIHANIRALVGFHEHLVRENGKESAVVFTRSRVIDNVRSDKALAVEDHHTWVFPQKHYKDYKSAEVHTFKRTIPRKYIRAAVLFALAAALVVFVVWKVGGTMEPSGPVAGQPVVAGALVGSSASADAAPEKPKWESDFAYAVAHKPRFGQMPWTAPVFDERPVRSEPELFCASSGEGLDAQGQWAAASCTCFTEQGTRYALGDGECRALARNGPVYNPYKEPAVSSAFSASVERGGVGRGGGAFGVGDDSFRAQQARYGQMRTAPIPSDYAGSGIYGSGVGQ